MTDIIDLGYRIKSDDIVKTNRRLDALERSTKQLKKSSMGLTDGFTKLHAAALASGAAAGGIVHKLVSVGRQTSILKSGLTTMTGSMENASKAFAELEKFASKTPFTLDQSVEAFTKLKALGLDPSAKAMLSYGNTAAAMGKDMSQMIEAVADASTGEFERLKEFGIKASSEGDKVSFTFQGVTKTVGKNSREIQEYLRAIGDENFSTAMADRMNTLDGALSNLEDSWNGLFRAVNDSGVGGVIEDIVRDTIVELQVVTDFFRSGAANQAFKIFSEDAKGAFNFVIEGLELVVKGYQGLFDFIDTESEGAARALSDNLIEGFSSPIQLLIKTGAVAQGIGEDLKNAFEKAKIDRELFDDARRLRDAFQGGRLTQSEFDEQMRLLEGERQFRYKTINEETDAAIASIFKISNARLKQREMEFKKIGELFSAANGDGGEGGEGGDDVLASFGDSLASEKAAAEARKKFLKENQTNPEEKIEDFTARKNALDQFYQEEDRITKEHFEAGYISKLELNNLLLESEREYQEELARIRQNSLGGLDQIGKTEEEILLGKQERELESLNLLHEAKLLSEEDYLTRLANLQMAHEEQTKDLRQKKLEDEFQMAEAYSSVLDIFGAYYDGMEGKQAGYVRSAISLGKTLLDEKKRQDLSDMWSSTYAASMKAFDAMASIPYIGPVLGAAAALAVMAAGGLAAGKMAGLYDKGGLIPSGQFGIVGERGPELVSGPASVLGREDTARLFARQSQAGVVNNSQSNIFNFNVAIKSGHDFVRPEAKRQIEAAVYNGLRQAARSYA